MGLQTEWQYKLLGTEVSLFCGKARAYMKWRRIPFKEVICTDEVYRTLIKPHASVISIPCLLIHEPRPHGSLGTFKIIQDTKDIIDYFEHAFPPSTLTNDIPDSTSQPVIPSTPARAFANMLLEMLADEWLLLQSMYWRWGDGLWEKERFEEQRHFLEFEFGNTASGGRLLLSLKETCKIGQERVTRFHNSISNLGISATTSPTLRAQFYRLLHIFSLHLQRHPFLLGSAISIADFAFYGHFYAHLGRDPIPSTMIKLKAPLVWEWIERVGGCGRYGGKDVERWDSKTMVFWDDHGRRDDISNEDIVPKTTNEIVNLLMKDYVPIIENAVQRTLLYILEKQPVARDTILLPRSLGTHTFRLSASEGSGAEDVFGERLVWTHGLWIFQRILDRTYNTQEQRKACDQWLREAAGPEVLGTWQGCVHRWEIAGWSVERDNGNLAVKKRRNLREFKL